MSLREIDRCMTRLQIVLAKKRKDQHIYPILLALLIYLHGKKRDVYNKIINNEDPPEYAMEFISSMNSVNNEYISLHAFLLVADPDEKRSSLRRAELEKKSKQDPNSYEARILEFRDEIVRKHYFETNSNHIPLSEIAKLIDLAAWVE